MDQYFSVLDKRGTKSQYSNESICLTSPFSPYSIRVGNPLPRQSLSRCPSPALLGRPTSTRTASGLACTCVWGDVAYS